jgi:hypothetical protein
MARWPAKIVAAKHRAVEGSWKVVDAALDVAGGFGIFRQAGLALAVYNLVRIRNLSAVAA